MINIKEDEKLSVLNHSCAHLMAQAITHLYPNAKFWVGPAIEEGFYYDIDLGDEVVKEEDLIKLQNEINSVVGRINAKQSPIEWFIRDYKNAYQKRRH